MTYLTTLQPATNGLRPPRQGNEMTIEIKINLGPKANNNFAIVTDYNTLDEKWYTELNSEPRERILTREAEDMLSRKNRLACKKYFPMHGFSS